MKAKHIRVERQALEQFCQQVFQVLHMPEEDSKTAASVLVTANAYGIPSHGVGRLWRYVNGLKTGLMLPDAPIEILVDTPSSVVIDAQGAMGI